MQRRIENDTYDLGLHLAHGREDVWVKRVRDREEPVGLVGNLVDLLDVVVDGSAHAALGPVRLAVLLAKEGELAELVTQLGAAETRGRERNVPPELWVRRRELGRERGPECRQLQLDLPARRWQPEEQADDEALEPAVDLMAAADLQG
jgi:hypothetical protein